MNNTKRINIFKVFIVFDLFLQLIYYLKDKGFSKLINQLNIINKFIYFPISKLTFEKITFFILTFEIIISWDSFIN